jgi:hypothetical protein
VTLPPTVEFAVCPPGQDVLAQIAFRAEAEADRIGWGGEREAPLYWFWLHDNGRLSADLASIAMSEGDLGPELQLLYPVQLIQTFEHHLRRVQRTLMGFVLVSEGWMATYSEDNKAEMDSVWAAANRREIWRRPDRMEIRTARLQMLSGQTRSVLRVRGQEPKLMADLPPSRDVTIEIPAAMARLATTLRLRKYGRRG